MKKETTFALPTTGKRYENSTLKVGAVAQSVEQRTENPCVVGSIPTHTTLKSFREIWSFFVLKGLAVFKGFVSDQCQMLWDEGVFSDFKHITE